MKDSWVCELASIHVPFCSAPADAMDLPVEVMERRYIQSRIKEWTLPESVRDEVDKLVHQLPLPSGVINRTLRPFRHTGRLKMHDWYLSSHVRTDTTHVFGHRIHIHTLFPSPQVEVC
jgi:hypothetical protein